MSWVTKTLQPPLLLDVSIRRAASISASPPLCLPASLGRTQTRGHANNVQRAEEAEDSEPQWNPNFFFDSPLVSAAFPHSRSDYSPLAFSR